MHSGGKTQATNNFDQWAMRNGYLFDAFSGEKQIHATNEVTLLDLTVPKGQTWYRRFAWYTAVGARVGRFKVHRTYPPKPEEYFNLVVVPANDTHEIETVGKYPAGSSLRVSVRSDPLAISSDLVTARVLYVALPWEE